MRPTIALARPVVRGRTGEGLLSPVDTVAFCIRRRREVDVGEGVAQEGDLGVVELSEGLSFCVERSGLGATGVRFSGGEGVPDAGATGASSGVRSSHGGSRGVREPFGDAVPADAAVDRGELGESGESDVSGESCSLTIGAVGTVKVLPGLDFTTAYALSGAEGLTTAYAFSEPAGLTTATVLSGSSGTTGFGGSGFSEAAPESELGGGSPLPDLSASDSRSLRAMRARAIVDVAEDAAAVTARVPTTPFLGDSSEPVLSTVEVKPVLGELGTGLVESAASRGILDNSLKSSLAPET
mmetsp:Transcript_6355/g.14656  ORF Transcript_6355/g.14656 Transcript_6355/m.14656 type:complete len:297 (-) Transcript_6355:584-1474(-)